MKVKRNEGHEDDQGKEREGGMVCMERCCACGLGRVYSIL